MDGNSIIMQVWGLIAWLIPSEPLIGPFRPPREKAPKDDSYDAAALPLANGQADLPTPVRCHPEDTIQRHADRPRAPIWHLRTRNEKHGGWISGSGKQVQWTQRLYSAH